jgi:hypothetical protein
MRIESIGWRKGSKSQSGLYRELSRTDHDGLEMVMLLGLSSDNWGGWRRRVLRAVEENMNSQQSDSGNFTMASRATG